MERDMKFCVTKQELEKALAMVNQAVENGFENTLAVMRIYTGGETLDDFLAKSDGIILKAHPTDPNLNWGHTNHPEWQKYVNGECVDI